MRSEMIPRHQSPAKFALTTTAAATTTTEDTTSFSFAVKLATSEGRRTANAEQHPALWLPSRWQQSAASRHGKVPITVVVALIAVLVVVGIIVWQIYSDSNPVEPRPTISELPGGKSLQEILAEQSTTTTKPAATSAIRFVDAKQDSGILFRHETDYTAEKYIPEVISGGVLVGDFNGDGAPDLVAINGGIALDRDRRSPGRHDRLFINDGTGKFTDQTKNWGLDKFAVGFGMGGAVGDYDGDGKFDLFLTSWEGGNRLLRNMGNHFSDVTAGSGLDDDKKWGTSAGFLDYDLNGTLDLFVVRYVEYTIETAYRCFVNNVQVYCTPTFPGVPDKLYRNRGDGTFEDVSLTALPADCRFDKIVDGVPDFNACKGLAVGIGDLNGDGWPDVYVANDISRNFLLINNKDGTFSEVGRVAGVAYGEDGMEQSGMGVAMADVDENGLVDLVCTNFQKEPTNLYMQSAPLTFFDRSDQRGIGTSSRARLSFGINFFDADNDGDEDLFMANGHIHDNVETFSQDVTFAQPNTLFEAVGQGKFKDVTTQAGPALADAQVSRGSAIADFNGDGRQDFVVANNRGTLQVGLNQSATNHHFISFRLEGTTANRSAIGAKVTVKTNQHQWTRELQGANSYLAASEAVIHFGLGAATEIQSVTVAWPGQPPQELGPLVADQFYFVRQGEPAATYRPGKFSAQ